MTFTLSMTSSAKRDVQRILRHIEKRSRRGAEAWYRRFAETTAKVASAPESFGLAAEDERHDETIRQAIFKTR